MLPDADVVSLYLGIPYGHPVGHRGFNHSLLFAVLTGALVAAFWRRLVTRDHQARMLLVYFSVATALDGLLDAPTNGGTGVGFFIPFDSGRYFFPTGQFGQFFPVGSASRCRTRALAKSFPSDSGLPRR